jgi:hemerythrin-like domain-containing protein
MSNPIDMLVLEHKIILKVVHAFSVIDTQLEHGKAIDTGLIVKIVAFMRDFADKCHHAKEEDILFPAMEAKGVPHAGCPIGGLLGEHAKGRGLVKALSDAGEAYGAGKAGAVAEMRVAISGIRQLYPNHIWKEDEMVFPMAARLFSAEEQLDMKKAFDQADDDLGQSYDSYVNFAEELAALHA